MNRLISGISRIIPLLLAGLLLTGCEKILKEMKESLTEEKVAHDLSCAVNGVWCSDTYIAYSFPPSQRSVGRYNLSVSDTLFYFRIEAELKYNTAVRFLEILVMLPQKPRPGVRYEFTDVKEFSGESGIMTGCWAALETYPWVYEVADTLELPEEIRKKKAYIPTDCCSGYIIFDEIQYATRFFNVPNGDDLNFDDSYISGHFSFTARGQNACYPEMVQEYTVTDGSFKYHINRFSDDDPRKTKFGRQPYFYEERCIVEANI